ncbi:MAG: glutamine--fructose-6-phosphate transaminase (isomerizing) [Legionellales bacterium]|nr:glutamine--fructose-6-phosphate transaminase (isomerizing) [Legionellales bacterium]
MCGIVAGVAQRNVTPILLEGLRRLEYRGYDSAGVAVAQGGQIVRARTCGKVIELSKLLEKSPIEGQIGLAHTRWATHGKPSERNAHPHMSQDRIAIVHNGIIENHESLAAELKEKGYELLSDTDTEVIVHILDDQFKETNCLKSAVARTINRLEGAYALVVMAKEVPDTLFVACKGAPLVIGRGIEEMFVASDVLALLPVTQEFVYLQDGDMAQVKAEGYVIWDAQQNVVQRVSKQVALSPESVGRGSFRHYMQKEIHEQPWAVSEALEGRLSGQGLSDSIFGAQAAKVFDATEQVHIVACGTSFHAGWIARYWLESLGIPCQVEVASEYRYREAVIPKGTLLVTISQSGETADTLAALRSRRAQYLSCLTICNVPESSLVRESDLCLLTHAGPEVGVASTKAFTTQLVALQLFCIALGRRHQLTEKQQQQWLEALKRLPDSIEKALGLDRKIRLLAQELLHKSHALYLGRGAMYPVALEGALKLKEISYIHAEAYPAGELKHGPLALVDENMPVIAVAPNDALLSKLQSNLQEVQARGGQIIIFADEQLPIPAKRENMIWVQVPHVTTQLAPILFTIPLQLLAYHVAVLKGTDVDQPRNLAKSVTVE